MPYKTGLEKVIDKGLAYQCTLSRKEIERATQAPQQEDVVSAHPTRPEQIQACNQSHHGSETNWRFVSEDLPVTVPDKIQGDQEFLIADDFVIWTKDSLPSYQLAVVVDDHRQGVTDVVRANDLLDSAARQTMLYNAFGWETPTWWHLPLVIGDDGKKLGKRHGDTRVLYFRDQGIKPEIIIGLIAFWCSFTDCRKAISIQEFLQLFDYQHHSTRYHYLFKG